MEATAHQRAQVQARAQVLVQAPVPAQVQAVVAVEAMAGLRNDVAFEEAEAKLSVVRSGAAVVKLGVVVVVGPELA